MRVTDQISQENKNSLRNLNVELQVLKNLVQERQTMFTEVVREVLTSLTPNPTHYSLRQDSATGEWELELRPETLVLPGQDAAHLNRAARRQLGKN